MFPQCLGNFCFFKKSIGKTNYRNFHSSPGSLISRQIQNENVDYSLLILRPDNDHKMSIFKNTSKITIVSTRSVYRNINWLYCNHLCRKTLQVLVSCMLLYRSKYQFSLVRILWFIKTIYSIPNWLCIVLVTCLYLNAVWQCWRKYILITLGSGRLDYQPLFGEERRPDSRERRKSSLS